MNDTPAPVPPHSPRMEIFPNRVGGWHYRVLAGNGEILVTSEAYTRKHDAHRGADTLEAVFATGRLPREEVEA